MPASLAFAAGLKLNVHTQDDGIVDETFLFKNCCQKQTIPENATIRASWPLARTARPCSDANHVVRVCQSAGQLASHLGLTVITAPVSRGSGQDMRDERRKLRHTDSLRPVRLPDPNLQTCGLQSLLSSENPYCNMVSFCNSWHIYPGQL